MIMPGDQGIPKWTQRHHYFYIVFVSFSITTSPFKGAKFAVGLTIPQSVWFSALYFVLPSPLVRSFG